MVVPPDDWPRYARNMYRLTKYTKHYLCIKLIFLYAIIPRCAVNKIEKIVLSTDCVIVISVAGVNFVKSMKMLAP